MLNNLLRFNKNQKYIVFDFETESLNLFYNKPWQLSFVIATGNKVIEEHDYFIDWPDLKVGEEAAKINHFNLSDYNKSKQDARKVLDCFEGFLYDKDYIIVGHNIIGFDIYIHNIYRKLLGKSSNYTYLERLIDTNCLSKAIKLQIPKKKDESVFQWMSRLNFFHKRGLKTSQKQMLKENNIDFEEELLHNSLYDVQMNFELFRKLIYQIDI